VTLTCPCCARRLAVLVPEKQYQVTIWCRCGHAIVVETGLPRGVLTGVAVGPTEYKEQPTRS